MGANVTTIPSDDPYAILGVPRDAPQAAIRKAYIAAAKRAHPDAGGDATTFAQLGQAYARIGTAAARRKFDRGEPQDRKGLVNAKAMMLIAHLAKALMERDGGPRDFLAELRGALREHFAEADRRVSLLNGTGSARSGGAKAPRQNEGRRPPTRHPEGSFRRLEARFEGDGVGAGRRHPCSKVIGEGDVRPQGFRSRTDHAGVRPPSLQRREFSHVSVIFRGPCGDNAWIFRSGSRLKALPKSSR
jgi:curved DNA-binding protein CbpA